MKKELHTILDDLITYTITELNPQLLDDDLPDAYEDYEKRAEAVAHITKYLQEAV